MKCIIAGSRSVTDYEILLAAIAYLPWRRDITEIVSGGADGADALGERYAKERKLRLTVMPADWIAYGRSAGPRRNRDMAQYVFPDGALIALWDGESRGTQNMIEEARKRHLKVLVWDAKGNRPWYEKENEDAIAEFPPGEWPNDSPELVEKQILIELAEAATATELQTQFHTESPAAAVQPMKRLAVAAPCEKCRCGEHKSVARIKDAKDNSKTVAIVLECKQCGHRHESTSPQAFRLALLAIKLQERVEELNRKYGPQEQN